ncbi:alpha/beta fold hydrolase [Blastococcus sp. SYSU D00820]
MTTATSAQAVEAGTSGNGMPYLRWGDGPRSLVFLPGGPGGVPPSPRSLRWSGGMYRPYVDAGYAVWVLVRRRNMPAGHTIADMADDVADVIRDELGGRVDAVVGMSYGGLIAQHLAARHPGRVGSVVLIGAAARLSDWVQDADLRWAVAASRGDRTGLGVVIAEYLVPGRALSPVRRLLAPVLGRAMFDEIAGGVPPGDLLVEGRAEQGFDARPVLPRITAPVLVVAGGRDRAFPPAVVEETAGLLADCRVVRLPRRGHVGAGLSRRGRREVVAFLAEQERAGR